MTDKKRCVIFDLDGTLADTRKDIANSVNLTRKDYGLDLLPVELVASYTGDGAAKLLERSFAGLDVDLKEALGKMVQHYYDFPIVDTVLYPGVAEGLQQLKEAGWMLGVVTNKPGIVAREVLDGLNISSCLDALIGGGDGFPLKPDPAAMFHLLKQFNAEPALSWILGDNHTDLNSAVNAGMNGAFAEWGFGHRNNAPCNFSAPTFLEFVRHVSH